MLNIEELMKILPHRYPFLLIDRIIKLDPAPASGSWEGRKGTAIKNVTFNEPFFPGHFPGRPIMPGVLVIEAMAQTAGIVGYRPPVPGQPVEVIFLGIDNARFRKLVVPGDQVRFELVVTKDRGSIFAFHGEAFVDNELVAEADLLAKSFFKKG